MSIQILGIRIISEFKFLDILEELDRTKNDYNRLLNFPLCLSLLRNEISDLFRLGIKIKEIRMSLKYFDGFIDLIQSMCRVTQRHPKTNEVIFDDIQIIPDRKILAGWCIK